MTSFKLKCKNLYLSTINFDNYCRWLVMMISYDDDRIFSHRYIFSRYINKNPITKSKYHEMDVEEYFSNSKIYNYSNMDSDYVDTLNEYNKNH